MEKIKIKISKRNDFAHKQILIKPVYYLLITLPDNFTEKITHG